LFQSVLWLDLGFGELCGGGRHLANAVTPHEWWYRQAALLVVFEPGRWRRRRWAILAAARGRRGNAFQRLVPKVDRLQSVPSGRHVHVTCVCSRFVASTLARSERHTIALGLESCDVIVITPTADLWPHSSRLQARSMIQYRAVHWHAPQGELVRSVRNAYAAVR